VAFSYNVLRRTIIGNMRLVLGTYTNGSSDTGGNIDTGLRIVEFFAVQPTGSAVASNASVVNESFPVSGGVITIVTDSGQDGVWIAIGK